MQLTVNIERVSEIVGDNVEMKKTLLQLFIDSLNNITTKISEHIRTASSSQKEWADLTHELKGAAYNLGFNDLGDYCNLLEERTLTLDQKKAALEVYLQANNSVQQILNGL